MFCGSMLGSILGMVGRSTSSLGFCIFLVVRCLLFCVVGIFVLMFLLLFCCSTSW